jgi:hypothetical protein
MSERRWHVDRSPPLSRIEMTIKLAAFGVAYAAFVSAIARSAEPTAWGARPIAQIVILGVLGLGLIAAIWGRWRRRDVVSMIFVLLSNAAHWGLLAALLRTPSAHSKLVIFAALMWFGDAMKVLSFHVRPLPVRDLSPAAGTALTGIFVVGYMAICLLESL